MAEEEVGSLNVSVGLSTAEFNRGIKEVTQRMQIAGQEFRNASASLDTVGDAAEISRLNITRLTSQISAQQTIVDQLRGAHQRAAEQYGETSRQAQAYQLRLSQAEGTLQSMERNLTATNERLEIQSSRWTALGNSMQSASDRLSSVGEGMNKAGQALSVGVTAPILAAGGAMLKGAIDAENAQSKLQASLGITTEEAKELGSVATDVWDDAFGENIEEVDAAIITVRKNMGDLADGELKSVTEGAMTIADVFGAEVTDSTKAAGTMMENFGISGQDALDLITVGFQQGGDYSGELIDTLSEYSPQFSAMGLSADQMMGILISGAQAGAFNLDKVGDAMKEFNIRAQDGSKATSEGFAAIGLDAQQMGAAIAKGGEDGQKAFTATVTALAAMKDPMAQNAAGTALFGTQWEDVRSKVIVAMADGVKGIGDFKGATDSAAAAMYNNNPGAALTSAMRELQAAIGPALLPLASIITNDVVPAFKSLADSFSNLSPEGQKVVLTVAGIAAAIGPVLVVSGTLVSAVGSISGAFATASGAIAAAGGASAVLGTAFAALTGPIGLTVLGIAGITAVGVALVNHFKQDAIPAAQLFGEETSEATKKAVQGYVDLDDKATKSLMSLKLNGSVVSKETADALTKNFEEMGTQIKAGMDKHYGESLKTMQDFFANSSTLTDKEEAEALASMAKNNEDKKKSVDDGEKQIKLILDTASAAKRALNSEEQAEINYIQETMKTNAVKTLSETELESKSILERMKAQAGEITAQQAAEVVKNSIEQKDKAVKNAEEQYNKTVQTIIKQRDETGSITAEQANKLILEAGRQKDESVKAATEMNNKVVDQAKLQAKDHAKEVDWTTGEVKSKWQIMKEDTAQKMTDIGNDLSSKWESVKKDTSDKMEGLKSSVTEKWSSVKSESSAKIDEIKASVSGKFEEISQAVSGKMTELKGQVIDKWNDVKQYLSSISLSQIGSDIIQGLINGITGRFSGVRAKIEELAQMIPDWAKKILDIRSPSKVMQQIGQFIAEGLIVGMEDGEEDVLATAKKVATGIESSIKENLTSIDSFMGQVVTALKDQYADMEEAQLDSLDEQVENVKSTSEKVLEEYENQEEAIKEQYDKLEEAQLDSLDEQVKNAKKASEEMMDQYDKEYMSKLKLVDEESYNQIKSIQDKLDSIDELTEAEEKAIKEQEQQSKQSKLQKAIDDAQDEETRIKATEDLYKFLSDIARDKLLEQRKEQKESLTAEIKAVKDNSDEKKDALKEEYEAKKKTETEKTESVITGLNSEKEAAAETWDAFREGTSIAYAAMKKAETEKAASVISGLNSEKEATKQHYEEMSASANVEAEARKLMLGQNQTELVALMSSYAPQWQNAGQSLSSQLLDGLNSEKVPMQDAIATMLDMKPHVDKQVAALAILSAEITTLEQTASTTKTGVVQSATEMKEETIAQSKLQASEVIANSLKQKDEAVKKANEEYTETVAAITKQRDETGILTTGQANTLIAEAGRQRDDTITAATTMNTKVVEQVALQTADVIADAEKQKKDSTKAADDQKTALIDDAKVQREKVIADAEKQYADSVTAITSQKTESTTLSSDQKTALIDDAKVQREKVIADAETMNKGVVAQAKIQAEEHTKEVVGTRTAVATEWTGMVTDTSTAMDGVVAAITTRAVDMVAAGTSLGQQFSAALQANIKQPSYNVTPSSNGNSGHNNDNSDFERDTVKDRVYDDNGSYTDYDSDGDVVGGGRAGTEDLDTNGGIMMKKHDGGWIGEKLQADEVPIIAQLGEFILSKEMVGNISNLGNRLKSVSSVSAKNNQIASNKNEIHLHFENKGTIVGSGGMKEFAKTVSVELARTTGLAMGGAY